MRSYARGEANDNSNIDIYYKPDLIKSKLRDVALIEELEKALFNKIDIIYTSTTVSAYFKKQIEEDMIKLC